MRKLNQLAFVAEIKRPRYANANFKAHFLGAQMDIKVIILYI